MIKLSRKVLVFNALLLSALACVLLSSELQNRAHSLQLAAESFNLS